MTEKITLNVKGMHCASCENSIKKAVREIGAKASVDVKAGKVSAEFDPAKVGMKELKAAIQKAGYKVV
ncbi:MAG: heavy-metal-associated domain-containing protein [Candidatus Aenigmarchaeota archaeon]|nr:heavy-metal-associated domain-containing protein [Candidatus Aenigmarchaeota archaeon]